MDSLVGKNPSLSHDPVKIRERPDLAGATDESRQGLAQLIGRLLARQWLRDRHRRGPERHHSDVPAQEDLV